MKRRKQKDGVVRLFNFGSGLVSVCAGMLAAVMILYSGYVLYDSFATELNAFSANSDLLRYKPVVMAEPSDTTPSLADVNEDYRAWITVTDSPIDYPVVQGKDDLYYASHDVYRESSLTGAIYLAAANSPDFSDSYNLLYGHHMDNGAMFGSLDKFKDSTYFQSHRTAVLTTGEGKIYDVTFFAVANTDAYESRIYTVGNRAGDVINFLTGARDADTGLGTEVLIYDNSVTDIGKILALSTCASADTNGRLVVFGRMIERLPEPTPTPEPTVTPDSDETPTPEPTATPEPSVTPDEDETPTPEPTGEPSPTPGGPVTLTVRYFDENGELLDEVVLVYNPGDDYYVVTPQYPGYDVSIEVVHGTIWEDKIVIVHLIPKTYHLRIHYLFMDGTRAANPYEQEIRTGEEYDIASPSIPGYTTLRLRIHGTNPGRNEEYTVIYVPEEVETLYNIETYETPMNPGETNLQIGIGVE